MSTVAQPADGAAGSRVWRLAPYTLVALTLVAATAGAPPPTALVHLFFVPVLLGGIVAAAGMLGWRAQTGVALAGFVLVLGQRAIQRPISAPPSSQWTQSLASGQIIRHGINLPAGTSAWERAWDRPATSAMVWLCARGPLTAEDGLLLAVNGLDIGAVTEARAIGPRPQPTSVGFYRMPVARMTLERSRLATFELRRSSGATTRPIEICGTFTYQPTAGMEASQFFDGVAWHSPGATQRGRYVIELRLEGTDGRPFAVYY